MAVCVQNSGNTFIVVIPAKAGKRAFEAGCRIKSGRTSLLLK